jgi:dTDP-4-dehydrorhamnose reductase
MKNIFITGESGTIPMQMQLFAKDFDFNIINTQLEDNWLTGLKSHQSFKVRKPELDFLIRDFLLNYSDLWSQVDLIIHSGAFVGTDFCMSDPSMAIRTNVEGTQNIVDICNKFHIPLIYLSTTAILDPSKYSRAFPMTDMTEINPQTIYGITKYAGELIVRNTCNPRKLILRPVFGFGNYPDDLHSALTKAIYVLYKNIVQKSNNPLTILLDWYMPKSYTRVENIALCILNMAQKYIFSNDSVVPTMTYNIGESCVKAKNWEQLLRMVAYNFEIKNICMTKDVNDAIDDFITFVPEKDYLGYHNMDDIRLKLIGLDFDSLPSYVSLDQGISLTIDSVIENVKMEPYWL